MLELSLNLLGQMVCCAGPSGCRLFEIGQFFGNICQVIG